MGLTAEKSNFDIDLDFGRMVERKVANLFENGNRGKIEVKGERQKWKSTGNLAIEISFRGRPSGIMTSQADWWFHVYMDGNRINHILVFPVDRLRAVVNRLIDNSEIHVVPGGDGNMSRIALIPMSMVYQMAIMSLDKTRSRDD